MKKKLLNILFFLQYFYVAFVSCYDTYLLVKFRAHVKEFEENPFARWIMMYDNWDVSLFIGIKMFGTILFLTLVLWIYFAGRKTAFMTIGVLVAFQTFLLLYLHG